MNVRRVVPCLSIVVAVIAAVTGCANEPKSAVGPPPTTTSAASEPLAEAEAPPVETPPAETEPPSSAPISWQDHCFLSTDEVTELLSAYGFVSDGVGPLNDDESSTQCYYGSSGSTSSALGIDGKEYGSGGPYGFGTNHDDDTVQPWTAPDATTAAANACAVVDWTSSYTGETGTCTEIADIPFVMASNRNIAMLFPAGDRFYVFTLYATDGTEESVEVLIRLAERLVQDVA